MEYRTGAKEPEQQRNSKSGNRQNRHRGNLTGGLILIAVGFIFLLNNLFPSFSFRIYWPVILIAIGIGLLINATKEN